MRAAKRFAGALALVLAGLWSAAGLAAERDELRGFLEITGFDISITSLQHDVMTGAGMSGAEADEFGNQYVALAETVFDPELMLERAIDMMQAVLPDELVAHGIDFYASELGQRLVAVENESHMADSDTRQAVGEAILAELSETNPARVADYRAMLEAIGGVDTSVRAIIEVQIRYLLAAMAAGSSELGFSEEELRALMAEQIPTMRRDMEQLSLVGAAYTYRDMTDDDVAAYRAALEQPAMKQVYEVLNAIQYQVMAERYEALAVELAKLAPQTEL